MMMLKRSALAALLALTPAMAVAAACPPVGGWMDARTGAALTAAAALDRLAAADVVLLGESHGYPDVHLWQATTAAALAARRGGVQLGYEMFPRAAQPALDAWTAGKVDQAAFLEAANWSGVWGFGAGAYDPILRLPRLLHAKAIALNVDRKLVRRVGREGWASVPAADRQGLGDPAPALPAYRERLDAVLDQKAAAGPPRDATHKDAAPKDSAHQNAAPDPAKMRDRFIEAQLVWDRAFAEAIQAGLAAAPETPVVAFMGRGHVEFSHGVAHQLADLGVFNTAAAIAVFTGEDCAVDADSAGRPLADLVFGAPSPDPAPPPPARPRIGVYIQDAAEGGAEIARVTADSPAAAAGFQAGDIVVEAAGQPIRKAAELGAAIRAHTWGAWLPFKVMRGGEALELVAKLPKGPHS